MKQLLKSAVVLSSLFFGVSASAATITSLYDSFETEITGAQANNYNDFTNWQVTNGSVDLYGTPNAHFTSCSDGNYCVDLDGSSKDAGIFTTRLGFAAGTYKVSFDLAGNQRSGTDTIDVAFGAGSLINNLVLAADTSWSSFNFIVSLSEGDKLSFANAGGDNIGILLDNVSVSAVPVPAAAFLFAPALLGFIGLRRKAAKKA